jgi:Flp pilus assembly protein TadG
MGWFPRPMRLRRSLRAKRGKERGAVAVEFALSLFLLIPLLLATLDYGYYFWVGLHAAEAANAGARAGAEIIRSTTCANLAKVGNLASPVSTTPQNAAFAAKAAIDAEMAKTGLATTTWQTSPGGITQSCQTVSLAPAWSVSVRVDFAPPIRYMLSFMPQSSTAGYTRFISKTVVMP